MKLIEALKMKKLLLERVEETKKLISEHCADIDFESPYYGTEDEQRKQVQGWLQSVHDTLLEVERLGVCILRTNLQTDVAVELPEVGVVKKSISAWIERRDKLAKQEEATWRLLTDRGLKDGAFRTSAGQEVPVKVRRYFDPKKRDVRIEAHRSEPSIIDGVLEVVNAVTDLIEI